MGVIFLNFLQLSRNNLNALRMTNGNEPQALAKHRNPKIN
jgi:hypothetical protein